MRGDASGLYPTCESGDGSEKERANGTAVAVGLAGVRGVDAGDRVKSAV